MCRNILNISRIHEKTSVGKWCSASACTLYQAISWSQSYLFFTPSKRAQTLCHRWDTYGKSSWCQPRFTLKSVIEKRYIGWIKKNVSKFQLRHLRCSQSIKSKTPSQKVRCRTVQTQLLKARTQNVVDGIRKTDIPVKRLYRDFEIFKEIYGFRGCVLEGKDNTKNKGCYRGAMTYRAPWGAVLAP
jgi:hypothetical protein